MSDDQFANELIAHMTASPDAWEVCPGQWVERGYYLWNRGARLEVTLGGTVTHCPLFASEVTVGRHPRVAAAASAHPVIAAMRAGVKNARAGLLARLLRKLCGAKS